MNRILLMIMLFGILLSTVGCSQPAVTQPKDLPTRPSEPSASANLAIVSMQGGAGADVFLEYTPASEEQIAFIDLPSLPRYINPYPSGQGGPEYTMTQDLTQRIHDNLRHYLELWDSTLDVSALEFTTDADWEYACNYEADDFSALSWVNCITLQVEESGIDGSSGEEELLNEPTVMEIAYTAYAEPGYFIPCYRFYVREHDDPDLCTVIEAVPTA